MYTGRSMKESHQDLMISAAEWEAFLDDLQQTLDKFDVPQAEQAELKAIVDSTRDAIVVSPGSYGTGGGAGRGAPCRHPQGAPRRLMASAPPRCALPTAPRGCGRSGRP